MYHSPAIAGDATLEVLVSDGGLTKVSEPLCVVMLPKPTAGFGIPTVWPLSRTPGVCVCSSGGTGDGAADIYLDNICFDSAVAVDAAVTAFNGPARIAARRAVRLCGEGAQCRQQCAQAVKSRNGGHRTATAEPKQMLSR